MSSDLYLQVFHLDLDRTAPDITKPLAIEQRGLTNEVIYAINRCPSLLNQRVSNLQDDRQLLSPDTAHSVEVLPLSLPYVAVGDRPAIEGYGMTKVDWCF